MSGTEVATDAPTDGALPVTVPMSLEAITLPVADVDRAKDFYTGLGWRLDADISTETFRLVQLTPPLSAASINFGTGVSTLAAGSLQGLLLVVADIEAARDALIARGAEVSEVFHGPGAGFLHPPGPRASGRDPDGGSYVSWATFNDPDGNGWMLQEITERRPGRVWE